MLRILHTADWHLGQTFYEYDRKLEHRLFLDWLKDTLKAKAIDLLVISGDVFDVSNPDAASISMFYNFLRDTAINNPELQVIVTAGNHDSPSRLQAPNPLLTENITIIGEIPRNQKNDIVFEQLLIPVKSKEGVIVAQCIALPYLRPGDYPESDAGDTSYATGVTAFYQKMLECAEANRQPGQAIIALGHLHTNGAEISTDDKSERQIMGGLELVTAAAFGDKLAYVGLGHIHKPQKIGGRENIRYSGSPLPMSFSEINYKHQVVLVDIEGEVSVSIKPIHIPVTVSLMRVPAKPKTLQEALAELNSLPVKDKNSDMNLAPYLQVSVLLDGPAPSLRREVETAIENKYVRLAKIEVHYPGAEHEDMPVLSVDAVQKLAPEDVFKKIYQSRFNNQPADEVLQFFRDVVYEIQTSDLIR